MVATRGQWLSLRPTAADKDAAADPRRRLSRTGRLVGSVANARRTTRHRSTTEFY